MAELAQTHPEMVRRYQKLVELVWASGWEIWIGSSTRSRQTQEDLYRRWLNGTYDVPSVANPYTNHGPSPCGWDVIGSYHMPQADGFSHALDLGWRGCSEAQFEALANRCGLQQTVPNESWHYQWWHRQLVFSPEPGLFVEQAEQVSIEEVAAVGTTIHQAVPRGDGRTQDILRMPAFGAKAGGMVVLSTVFVRQLPREAISDVTCRVFCNGAAQTVALGADGRTVPVWVTQDGLVSVECDVPVWFEGQETWVPDK